MFKTRILFLILFVSIVAGCQSNTPVNLANLPKCTKTDCNCSDFATQEEAQTVLDAFSGDDCYFSEN